MAVHLLNANISNSDCVTLVSRLQKFIGEDGEFSLEQLISCAGTMNDRFGLGKLNLLDSHKIGSS